MNRRGFLRIITPAALIAPLVAEELLWTPKRTWFLPLRYPVKLTDLSAIDVEAIIKKALGEDIKKAFDESMYGLLTTGRSALKMHWQEPRIIHVPENQMYIESRFG